MCKAAGLECLRDKMTDDQIQDYVHGVNGYEFLPTSSFPHFLIRHYLKTFKLPIFRHNMFKVAHETLGEIFVRDPKDGVFRFAIKTSS